ncbi:MAG: M1 family metallopeptidase [Anaerolineales bacterium]
MEKKLNMPRRLIYLILAIFFLLSSCSGAGLPELTAAAPTVVPNPSALTSRTAISASSGILTVTPTIPFSPVSTQIPPPISVRPLYTLNASLDYASHSIAVDETIFYRNSSGVTLPELVLAVEPNIWAGSFVMGGVLINGQNPGKISLAGDRLVVPLGNPLVPGGSLTMSIQYNLHLPAADRHHLFGFNTRQINLVDWYPFIVPYSGGWILHPPADVGEHLTYDVADFDVTVTLVAPSIPIVLAASAPAEMSPGSWHYRLQNVRTFVLSASPSYKTVSITNGGVTITSYFFSGDESPAGAVLDATTRAVIIYGDIFGSYQHSSLSTVESPFFDGMEYDGLFFLSQEYYASYDGTLLNNLVDIAVHETAHQWWFGLVGNDQAMEPWLDEALATYSEELFYEKNLPQISAWWKFRVESFSPAGWVDTDIYDGVNFRIYANAVYLRGAQFLEALRKKIGDGAFFAFLKDYAIQMSGKRATAEDFFSILGTHTSVNIMDLISSYFQHPQ